MIYYIIYLLMWVMYVFVLFDIFIFLWIIKESICILISLQVFFYLIGVSMYNEMRLSFMGYFIIIIQDLNYFFDKDMGMFGSIFI